ncbi:MAG: hypothetical protein JNK58_05755 [Phycisphaerae bacterium]|nr:hypothetical protein [Phycisphaerae bacterium]
MSSALASDTLLEVEGRPAECVRVLSLDTERIEADEPIADSWMGRRAGGVLAKLTAEEFRRLTACLVGGPRRGSALPDHPWARIVVESEEKKRIGVLSSRDDGRSALQFTGDEHWHLIDDQKFTKLIGAPRTFYLGGLRGPGEKNRELEERVIERRFDRAGEITVDRAALRNRFFSGGFEAPSPAKVKRDSERFRSRMPRGYDPRTPAGLVVWISPTGSGTPPETFFEIADEMDLFVAGADAGGNDRPPADRLQLALDVAANMIAAYHIDARRVYVSGLSGGGKIATILLACCPDVFTGCVPIAGTGWWRDTPIAGGKQWPRLFGVPNAEARALLGSRRIAPVTGDQDFNHGPVLASAKQMEEDGVPVKLFDIAGMGHSMPPRDSLRSSLEWVDEPWRTVRNEEEARGRELMRQYRAEHGSAPPGDASARELLQRMTRESPWTEESWLAVEWLIESAARK